MADVEITVAANTSSAVASLNALDRQASSIGGDGLGSGLFDTVGESADGASAKVSGLGSTISLASMAGGLAATALTTAIGAVTDQIGNAVARADTMNNFPKVMTSLGFSADEASASIEKISKSLEGLPTAANDMASMVQQLAAINGDLQTSTDLGLAFNNMMLAGGKGTEVANAAFNQFTQILSKGVPTMEDWRSLVVAAPGQMNQLAESLLGTGATANDLYTALGGGGAEATISMDQLQQKIVELNTTGGSNFASFEEQARSATGGIGTAMDLVGSRIAQGIQKIIEYFGTENIAAAIDDFSSSFSGIADGVVAGLDAMNQAGVGDSLSGIFGTLGDMVSGIAADVAPVLTQIGTALLPVLNGALQVLGGVLSVVWAVLQPIIDVVSGALTVALTALQPVFDAIGSALTFVAAQLSQLQFWIQFVVTWVQGNVGPVIDQIVQFFTVTIPEAITNFITLIANLPTQILEFLTQIITNVTTWVTQFVTQAVQAGSQFVTNVVNFLTGLPGSVAGFLSSVISSAASFVSDFAGKATSAASDFFNNIVNGLASLPDKMLEIGGNIVQGVADGITGAIGAVTDAIAGVADAALGGLSGLLGIASPSRVMRDQIGKWIPLGVVEGIEETQPQLDAALTHMISLDAVQSSTDAAAAAGTPTYQFICDGATVNQTQEMQDTFVNLLTDLVRRKNSLYVGVA